MRKTRIEARGRAAIAGNVLSGRRLCSLLLSSPENL
jgi:hypothetical protein